MKKSFSLVAPRGKTLVEWAAAVASWLATASSEAISLGFDRPRWAVVSETTNMHGQLVGSSVRAIPAVAWLEVVTVVQACPIRGCAYTGGDAALVAVAHDGGRTRIPTSSDSCGFSSYFLVGEWEETENPVLRASGLARRAGFTVQTVGGSSAHPGLNYHLSDGGWYRLGGGRVEVIAVSSDAAVDEAFRQANIYV